MGRPFPKGTSGNPAGKPKGAKDKRGPRGLVARIVTQALTQGEREAVEAYRKAVANPRLVSGALESGAKILKEIGVNADPLAGRAIIFNWISNVNPLALRAAAPRALAPEAYRERLMAQEALAAEVERESDRGAR